MRAELVDAGVDVPAEQGHGRGEQLQVGPEVGGEVHLQAQHTAVAGRGDLDVLDHVPAVRRGLVVLAAGGGPLHRPAQAAGDGQGDGLLGVDVELAAEAAAHVRGDHAQLLFSDAADGRHQQAHEVRDLRGRPERELAGGRGRLGQHGAWLHRGGHHPLLDEPAGHDHLGPAPRGGVVAAAERPGEGAVGGLAGVHKRGAVGERGHRVDDRGQGLVFDLHGLGRVRGLVGGPRRPPPPPRHRDSVPRRPRWAGGRGRSGRR